MLNEHIMRAIPGMAPIARVVRHEHERWDGRGYFECRQPVDPEVIQALVGYLVGRRLAGLEAV